ncbi:MAG: DUF308 domain-containing protein [Tannerellaceae bacterium]|jgi:uncharacterized membrane protein HdeD (DUF308 family)|nr:DUF308 domain-containing protein [Tannerellaceae bacterium]
MITSITENSITRSILATVAGLLMIMWPEAMIKYMIMAIGALFIIAGIYTITLYIVKREARRKVHTVAAAASLLLGALLMIAPGFFINALMYMWGILLAVAGIQQVVTLIAARRNVVSVPLGLYILPALIIVAGIWIMIRPGAVIAYTFIILGTLSLLYGISELIGWYKFRPAKKAIIITGEMNEENDA